MYDAAIYAIPDEVKSSHKRKNEKKETAQQSAQGPSSTWLKCGHFTKHLGSTL
jgi:hypothetical protein